jgi:hypothetical protein
MLGVAAAVLAGAGAMAAAASALLLIAYLDAGSSSGEVVSSALYSIAALAAVAAFSFAAVAFLGDPAQRWKRLGAGAALFAGSLVLSMAGDVIRAVNSADQGYDGTLVASEFVSVAAGVVFLTGAIWTAIGLLGRRGETTPGRTLSRERRLAAASMALAVSFGLAAAATLLERAAYAESPFYSYFGYPSDLAFVAAGLAISLVAAAIAAIAFLTPSLSQTPTVAARARRDRLLGIAAGVFALGYLAIGVGEVTIALDVARIGHSDTYLAALWLKVPAAFGYAIAGACVAVGLFSASRRALSPVGS